MKQFILKEYLKNPSKKIVTRKGLNVRILCTDAPGYYPIIALIDEMVNNSSTHFSYTKEGRVNLNNIPTPYDLFFAPEKKEGWINIYADICQSHTIETNIFTSKEDAERMGKINTNYIASVKIEWEE